MDVNDIYTKPTGKDIPFRLMPTEVLNFSSNSHFENIAVREAYSLEKSWQNATHTGFENEWRSIMRIAAISDINLPTF